MDLSLQPFANICFALHALTSANLDAWTVTELWQWIDECVKTTAEDYGLFVEATLLVGNPQDVSSAPALERNDTRVPSAPAGIPYGVNQTLVPLPADHLATIRAETTTGTFLLPTTVREIEAYDDDWSETTGPAPTRWVGDGLHVAFVTLYPQPTLPGAIQLVYRKYYTIAAPPAAPLPGTPPGPMPPSPSVVPMLTSVIGDMVALRAIAEARRVETDNQMPEAVAFAESLLGVYTAALAAYYGGGM